MTTAADRPWGEWFTGIEDRLVGLNEFSEVLGLGVSRAAQLRAERRRDEGFPPVVMREGGRNQVHRLGDLLEWVAEHPGYLNEIELDPVELARYRLVAIAERAAIDVGPEPVRRTMLALALEGLRATDTDRSGGDDDPFDPPLAAQRSRFRLLDRHVNPRTGATDVSSKQLRSTLAGEIRRVIDALPPDGAERAIDGAVRSVSAEQAASPSRATSAVAALAAIAVAARPGDLVADPTAGECEILLSVDRLTTAFGGDGIVAAPADRDAETAIVGRARLDLHGVACRRGWRPDSEPGIGSVPLDAQRIVIDPGRVVGSELSGLLRALADHLHRAEEAGAEGVRVVLVLAREHISELHLELVRPTALFALPKGIAGGLPEPVLLWIHDTAVPSTEPVTLIDLRHLPPEGTDRATWIHRFAEVAGHPDPAAVAELPWPELDPALPWFDASGRFVSPSTQPVPAAPGSLFGRAVGDRPWSWVASLDATRPSRSGSGTVAADNRAYAAALSRELERLIGATSTDDPARGVPVEIPPRPSDSPDGVLYDLVPDDARRVVRRLTDRLSDEYRGKRRGRPPRGSRST